MSFGYALSTSLLQLTRIYGAIANNGILLPLSLTKNTKKPQGERIFSSDTAHTLEICSKRLLVKRYR